MNSQALIDELERITHDKRTPNDISQELAAVLIAMRALATPAPIPDADVGVDAVAKLLPLLDEALEDLEIWGRHSDQGYRKLKDWYRQMLLATSGVSALQASAMVVPDGYALVELDTLARWESELDQIAGAGHISDELIRMLAASTAPGDSQ